MLDKPCCEKCGVPLPEYSSAFRCLQCRKTVCPTCKRKFNPPRFIARDQCGPCRAQTERGYADRLKPISVQI